jgi:class 3 adenylate cyclase
MSIDLCILRQGAWEIHSTYSPGESEKAVQDAIRYKQEKAYTGVVVIDDRTKSVLYGYTSSGKPAFDTVVKSLKEGKKNLRVQSMQTNMKNKPAKQAASPSTPNPIQTNSKLNSVMSVSMLSLIIAVTIFMVLLNIFNDLTSALVGAIFTAVSALIAFKIANFDPSTSIETVAKIVATKMHIGDSAEAPDMENDNLSIKDHIQNVVDSAVQGVWNEEQEEAPKESALGIILLCSGVIEHIHQAQNYKRLVLIEMTSDIIENSKFSIPKASTVACYKNILEYLAYPRYSSMYDMGYQLSKKFSASKDIETLNLQVSQAFEAWSSHQDVTASHNAAAAILFTDIVDFTSTHQDRGDNWMMRILNAHNDAVREGLHVTGGREIKHTGDGIMASFQSVKDALDAAIIAQRKINEFNIAHESERFEVRVGISYGEPVHIGGDLFGTPVNKAARVLSNTHGEEIAMSSEAWLEAKSYGYTAKETTGVEFKGFDGIHSLFKINWKEVEQS